MVLKPVALPLGLGIMLTMAMPTGIMFPMSTILVNIYQLAQKQRETDFAESIMDFDQMEAV